MKKCYVVTSGEYSDYRINAIFTTQKGAEDFITMKKKFAGEWCSDMQVEEYEMNGTEKFIPWFSVDFRRDGSTYVSFEDSEIETLIYGPENKVNSMCVAVMAESPEQALKIACDKRAKILAEQAGI